MGVGSSPSRTGEQFSFNTTAAQPQVRSLVSAAPWKDKWGHGSKSGRQTLLGVSSWLYPRHGETVGK